MALQTVSEQEWAALAGASVGWVPAFGLARLSACLSALESAPLLLERWLASLLLDSAWGAAWAPASEMGFEV
jgi:hypothetical protein